MSTMISSRPGLGPDAPALRSLLAAWSSTWALPLCPAGGDFLGEVHDDADAAGLGDELNGLLAKDRQILLIRDASAVQDDHALAVKHYIGSPDQLPPDQVLCLIRVSHCFTYPCLDLRVHRPGQDLAH